MGKLKINSVRWKKEKIIKFRQKNNILNCTVCGEELKDAPHHYVCKKCWEKIHRYA